MNESMAAEPARLRARNTDPKTSHQAAERSNRFASSHAECIYRALAGCGDSTAHELTELTSLSVVQIDRRLPELQRAGRVELVLGADGEPLQRDGFRVWRCTC